MALGLNLIILAVVILFVFIMFKLVKNIFLLILNSVIGFFALFGINLFLYDPIDINFWSVIIVAIGGIFGLVIELILHFFGIAF